MIAFDLDGVLVDIFLQIQEVAQDRYKVDLSKITNYDFSNKLTEDQVKRIFIDLYSKYKCAKIEEGATEVLNLVWEITRKPIKIVTARSSNYATETIRLIERFARVPFYVCFSGGHKFKYKFLKGDKCFVEDRRRTALELAEKGISVFLINKSYNNPLPRGYRKSIKRLKNLNHLLKILKTWPKN